MTSLATRDRAVHNSFHTTITNFHHHQHFRKKHIQEKALSNPHLPDSPLLPKSHCKSTQKHKRPPKMAIFSVPDEDSDSFVSEQDAMDTEGDSFQEQIDGVTRTANDPQWQAENSATAMLSEVYQHQQQTQQNLEAQQAGFARIQDQKKQYDFSPPKPLSARKSFSPIFHNHDQHMLYNDTPSSIGKRKRSESQPPARDTYHSDPDTDTSNPALRRIGGMFVTVYTIGATMIAIAWTYLSWYFTKKATQGAQEQQQELIAVETDHSGRKRRAVSSPASHDTIPPISPSSPTPSPADEAPPTHQRKRPLHIPHLASGDPSARLHRLHTIA